MTSGVLSWQGKYAFSITKHIQCAHWPQNRRENGRLYRMLPRRLNSMAELQIFFSGDIMSRVCERYPAGVGTVRRENVSSKKL